VLCSQRSGSASFPMPADILPHSVSHLPLHELYRRLQPITVDRSSSNAVFQNFGRTYRCVPLTVFQPETEYQLELILELSRRERQTVRAVGVGHSPSDLACTSGYMIQMNQMNKIIEVRYRPTRLSSSGCRYPVRSLSLEPRGFSPPTKSISRHGIY
jgi:FAD/FMN-containing dehydrogenase